LTSRTRCPGTFSVVTTSTAPPQGLQPVVVGYLSRPSLARIEFMNLSRSWRDASIELNSSSPAR
jgi:hypothetical protein